MRHNENEMWKIQQGIHHSFKKLNFGNKNSTTLRVRKLSPTLLLTKPSVPYLSCSDEKEIFKPGVAVPIIEITYANLIPTCNKQQIACIKHFTFELMMFILGVAVAIDKFFFTIFYVTYIHMDYFLIFL